MVDYCGLGEPTSCDIYSGRKTLSFGIESLWNFPHLFTVLFHYISFFLVFIESP